MLTRGPLSHQYGYWGYYSEPYHVLMLADAYPAYDGAPRMDMSRYQQVPLNAAVTAAGAAGFRPYTGMDPSDPGTWSRPYNPLPGMFARLHAAQTTAARSERPRKRRGFRRRG